RRMVVRQTASDTVTVVVEGRGTYPLDPSSVPPSVALVLDTGSTDGCGVARFSLSRCAFGNGTRRLACSPLPPIVPCSNPDPNALVACDARNAASVEEAYYAANGTFFAGMCSALPGFMPSPFVLRGGGDLPRLRRRHRSSQRHRGLRMDEQSDARRTAS